MVCMGGWGRVPGEVGVRGRYLDGQRWARGCLFMALLCLLNQAVLLVDQEASPEVWVSRGLKLETPSAATPLT